jgi:hypothetical protein
VNYATRDFDGTHASTSFVRFNGGPECIKGRHPHVRIDPLQISSAHVSIYQPLVYALGTTSWGQKARFLFILARRHKNVCFVHKERMAVASWSTANVVLTFYECRKGEKVGSTHEKS